MLITLLVLLLGTLTSAYAQCEVTPDFLPYGVDDTTYPMNDIPYQLGRVDGPPYNAFGASGTGWVINYRDAANYVSVSPISLSGMSAPFEMRPRKPASTGATDRVGELYWRISTDPADLARVYEVLCVHYDGVLIVTFKCYADDSQSTKSSFQIWLAFTDNTMVVVFVYDDPLDLSEGYIHDTNTYPLSVLDILDDYITATDITDTPTVADGETLPTMGTCQPRPPSSTCIGLDLDGCGPIARPDPRCDPMTCAWGSVSHTYSCPDERTCDMDCYGCDDDTPLCSTVLATMTCLPDHTKETTCSKTAGVGIILFMYKCVDPDNAGHAVEITCHELCCCEKNPSGGVGISTAIHCTSPGVLNGGFGEEAIPDIRAFCPGYDIPEWN